MRPIRTTNTKGIYGAPLGHEDEIGGLPYWRTENDFGGTTVWSVWEPTKEERRAIARGANVRLGHVNEPMCPVSMTVVRGEGNEAIAKAPETDGVPA